MVSYGDFIAFKSIFSPLLFETVLTDALSRAIPPPGTIPSLIAAFVAQIASSTLSFFSLSSTSELAPTLIILTLPFSLDNLFCILSFTWVWSPFFILCLLLLYLFIWLYLGGWYCWQIWYSSLVFVYAWKCWTSHKKTTLLQV